MEDLTKVKHPRKKDYYNKNKDAIVETVKNYQKENLETVKESRKRTYSNMAKSQRVWNARCKFYRMNLANFLVKRNYKGLVRALKRIDNILFEDEKLKAILLLFCDKKEETTSFVIKDGEDVIIEVKDSELIYAYYTERMIYKKGISKLNDFYNECPFVQAIFKERELKSKKKDK